jgi:hypothetical protein
MNPRSAALVISLNVTSSRHDIAEKLALNNKISYKFYSQLVCYLSSNDSANSLKQQSAGRHVAPLENIILNPCTQVFSCSYNCMLSGEATNTIILK